MSKASVSTASHGIVSQIGKGVMVLVGIGREDKPEDAQYMARKIVNLRLWDSKDGKKKWNVSVKSGGYEVLLVSQFTLFTVLKGNKPDFHNAMGGDEARTFFDAFVEEVRKELGPGSDHRVKTGAFGEMMDVALVNDGPVTINIDSQRRKE